MAAGNKCRNIYAVLAALRQKLPDLSFSVIHQNGRTILPISLPSQAAFEKHNRGDDFVFLFPLKRVLLFSVFICTVDTQPAPPCPVCHPVPRGLLWHVAPTLPSCTTRLTSHSHKPILVGSWSWRGYKRKRERERERERERRHTNTPPLSDTHTHTHLPPSVLRWELWQSGELFSLTDRIFSPGELTDRVASDPLQVCSYGTSAAMLDNELSSRSFSTFTTFLSLARWSPERDEAAGSSARFGDRGLLFYSLHSLT